MDRIPKTPQTSHKRPLLWRSRPSPALTEVAAPEPTASEPVPTAPAPVTAAPQCNHVHFFGQTPLDLTYRDDVTHGAARLYSFLSFQGVSTNGIVALPISTLTAEFGVSRRSLLRYLSELYAHGYAERMGTNGSPYDQTIRVLKPDQSDLQDYAKMTMRRGNTLLGKVEERQSKKRVYAQTGPSSVQLSALVTTGAKTETGAKFGTSLVPNLALAPNTIRESLEEAEALQKKEHKRTRPKGGLPALPRSASGPPLRAAPQTENWQDVAKRIHAQAGRLQTAKKTAASRRVAAQVAKPRGRRGVARYDELDATPRETWGLRHFYGHVWRKMVEDDPPLAHQPVGQTLNPKALAQLKALVTCFVDLRWPPEEALSRSLAVAIKYVDFVYSDTPRFEAALKLKGKVTPGVLYGFRNALLGEFRGTKALGRSSMAAADETSDAGNMRMGSTSKEF